MYINMIFKVKDDAKLGETYIRYVLSDAFDEDGNTVNLNVQNGSVNVYSYTLGDINNDGNINMRDVVLLRQYIIGFKGITFTSVQLKAADVYADGSVNIKDLARLRQYVAGHNVTLG